ncbi:hypothetical protein MPSEU_000051400 [Mayamaea pseudoterrestris]|nr:hypothetical protein MPSEU_000051400 [Mayamaea pseudoterrestris]
MLKSSNNNIIVASSGSSNNGPSLTRRRGVRSKRKLSWSQKCRHLLSQRPLALLLCFAATLFTLSVTVWLLFASSSSSSLSTRSAGVHEAASVAYVATKHRIDQAAARLPGVPHLLRGNVPNVPVPTKVAAAVKRDATAAAAGGGGGGGEAAAGKENDNKPPYPYSLSLPPIDYDISRDFVVLGGSRYTEYTSGTSPYSYDATTLQQSDALARVRRSHVKTAMVRSWKAYTQFAYGMDELLPWSHSGNNNWGGGLGLLLVDSLDTLWLMDLKDEFYQARDWVRDHWDPDIVMQSVSVFETTIRDLGGLLAAYDWSGDQVFLDKAEELGKRLLKCFDGSSTGIPFGMVNLKTGTHANLGWTGGSALVAEAGTLQVEFRYLAHATGKPEYATQVEQAFQILKDIAPEDGLYPYAIDNTAKDGKAKFTNDKVTFGAMGDSFYEYMLKIWIQGGRVEPMYRDMYDLAIDSMHKQLLQYSTPSNLAYIADRNYGKLDHKMDHLVCFMGGALALGAYLDPRGIESERAQRDLTTAKALTYTCYQMYARMNTGIAPEYVQFYEHKDFQIGRGAPHYLLRPEAVESLFILNQLTGDPIYREWGWEMFQAIEKYCRTDVAYGALSNVQDVNGRPRDNMESFFLAETLKYFYLLFDPDTEVDVLHKHVFNTEAHPLRIFPVYDQRQA